MSIARSPAELARALETLPRREVLRGMRVWEKAAGEEIGTTRKAVIVGRISRWVFDPSIAGRLVDSLRPEMRTVLGLANAMNGRSFVEMLCAGAALGYGDLLEATERCAILGLVVPVGEWLRPERLWFDGRLLHPGLVTDVTVPEPLAGVVGPNAAGRPVEVEETASVEPLLRVAPEESLAAALAVAAALIEEPLALTRTGSVSIRAARAAARAAGVREPLPLGFRLALLDALGLMGIASIRNRGRLVADPASLELLWSEAGAVESAVRLAARADLPAWAPETGDTEVESPAGYLSDVERQARGWLNAGMHAFFTSFVAAIPRNAGWMRADRLAEEAARRAPEWLIADERENAWRWRGERFSAGLKERRRFAAYCALFLARTCVRRGLLELGTRPGAALQPLKSLPPPGEHTYQEPWEDVLRAVRDLYLRPMEAPARVRHPEAPAGGTAPRLTGDLELHVAEGSLSSPDWVVAALAGEPLSQAHGDPVRRYRLTAATVARAMSVGVPREAIEHLLNRCRPAPAAATRRRVAEWLERCGTAVIRRGWLLARWTRRADRDEAVRTLPGVQPVGSTWALVPPSVSFHGTPVTLPGVLLGLDERGELVATDRPLLALAVASVAEVDRRGKVRPDPERIGAAGLTHEEAVRVLAVWAGGSTAVLEAVGAAVGRALGVREKAGVLGATVLLPPGAAAANRLRTALQAAGATVVPLSPRALLVVGAHGVEPLKRLAREEGLELEPAEPDRLLAALPSVLKSDARLDAFEELSVRAARVRLEQAMATGRPIRLLLSGRRAPRPVTARVHHLGRLDGLLTVWVELLDGSSPGRNEAHAIRDILGFGALV